MMASQLKKRYPEIWNKIYNRTIEDLKITLPHDSFSQKDFEVLAHNAAFNACIALHKKRRQPNEIYKRNS